MKVMLDLETLGTKPGSVITSIGAVKFDTEIRDTFYARVDIQSCVNAGLKMDVSTVLWWMKQENDARLELTLPGSHLRSVLCRFTYWFGSTDLEVWGDGATFDNVLLSCAYDAVGMKKPWSYKMDRCYRTLKNLKPEIPYVVTGTEHNALDDAKDQALHLINLLK